MGLLQSVHGAIVSQQMLLSSNTVLVALSGGPDSVSLLYALQALGYDVQAAHLNHQLRGAESDEDEQFVRSLCKRMAVRLTVGQADVRLRKKQERMTTQEAARAARYEFLDRVRSEKRLDKIATGHNQDDQVETVLLNIVRGAGGDGLQGIPYRRGPYIRPLLDTPRAVVEQFCSDEGLQFRQDSSNRSSYYSRNNVRSELIPYLERRFNAGVKKAVLRLAEISGDENDYMRMQANDWIAGRIALPVAPLAASPTALQRRIIREWLRERLATQLTGISHTVVEQIRLSLPAPFTITLPGGAQVVESDTLLLTSRQFMAFTGAEPLAGVALNAPGLTPFYGRVIEVLAVPEDIDPALLQARTWIAGDRIRLAGGSRKIQDIFTDAKVPRQERATYPVITERDEIIAVPGMATAARASGLQVAVIKEG